MMLPLHTHGKIQGEFRHHVFKVLSLSEALSGATPFDRIAIDVRGNQSVDLAALAVAGFGTILAEFASPQAIPVISALTIPGVVNPGDVIRVTEDGKVAVLYRRGANANALFVTNRCNNRCIMCSQPPRNGDDAARIREILDLLPLVDQNAPSLAVTGGEPTLLGSQLTELMLDIVRALPNTSLSILTNGRLLSDKAYSNSLADVSCGALWSIPLHGDTAASHDFVAQERGAFEQTVNGIYNLAARCAQIEIRVVLHRHSLKRLMALSEFIWRTMPFVTHVAFMGLEPMGFAKLNREKLYIDPFEYRSELEAAVWHLHDRGITSSIYNTPLCLLEREVWPLTSKSISDWKNMFIAECDECVVKEACSGFFASAGESWRSRGISAIKREVCPCPGIGERLCGRCSVGRVSAQSPSQV